MGGDSMKCRLPNKYKLTKKENQLIHEESHRVVMQLMGKETEKIVRKTLKMCCVALNREYGFGKARLDKLLNTYFKLGAEEDEDNFAYHLDKVVIDELGLKFEREEE